MSETEKPDQQEPGQYPEHFIDALKFDVALREHLANQKQEPTISDQSQEWAGMDGVTAYWLIQRHADGWADVGKMMDEWRVANQPEQKLAPFRLMPHGAIQRIPPRKPLTDEMVVAAARMLSDRQAAACNVDCGDMWKMHGNDFIEDARAALEAANGIKE